MSQLVPGQRPQSESTPNKPRSEAIDPERPMSRYEKLSFIVSVRSLIVSLLGFVLIIWSLNAANEALKRSIYGSISNWTFELDKAFLQSPELRPYFYDGKDIDTDDPLYPKAQQMAEYMLDTFDSVLEHKAYFPGTGGTPHVGWARWFYDSFDRSPILGKYIETNRRWYETSEIWPIYKRWKAYSFTPRLCELW